MDTRWFFAVKKLNEGLAIVYRRLKKLFTNPLKCYCHYTVLKISGILRYYNCFMWYQCGTIHPKFITP